MNKQLSHTESNQAQRKFPLTLVADGLQSPANVGSLFRVCEAFGIEKIYFCNSLINFDSPRLKKTARNTQDNVPFSIEANTLDKVKELKKKGYTIVSLEITNSSQSIELLETIATYKIALIVGNEQEGVSEDVLKFSDICTHIQMFGINSSMNVVQASSIAINTIINKFYTSKK